MTARGSTAATEASAAIPDDLLVDILSRLPAKSVHRFKCVSKPWRDLISDRNHRKRLRQALAGFLYHTWDDNRFPSEARHFTNVSGCILPLVKAALAFLPNHADIVVFDCCNCLLLCRHKSPEHYDYFVCNPATEKWVALPDTGDDDEFFPCCLAFDPAVSLHFHVFLYRETDDDAQVRIYSSRTGRWNHIVRDLSFDGRVSLLVPRSIVFFKGLLHFLTYNGVVIVMDLVAKEWKKIELPGVALDRGWFFLLGQCQGCLWYVAKDDNEYQISFWTLVDGAWSFKHSVGTMELFGGDFQLKYCEPVAFHPDCNILFFTGVENVLMSYDIDRGKARRLFSLGSGDLQSFFPYTPCFSETLADEA